MPDRITINFTSAFLSPELILTTMGYSPDMASLGGVTSTATVWFCAPLMRRLEICFASYAGLRLISHLRSAHQIEKHTSLFQSSYQVPSSEPDFLSSHS